jgi:iron complex transport system substrate-binding protein
MNYFPERIICLTEETTELLYLIGEQDRIVGISGFTVRPKRARKEKPKVSAFIDANVDEIIALKPDLVIGFSDIQADIAQELIKKGITVWVNNHRSVEGIFRMIVQLGALVGRTETCLNLVNHYRNRMIEIRAITAQWKVKPKVYFEEWYDPLISGIQWVSELVEIAGGVDLFVENGKESLAKNRIIENHQEVLVRDPDIILASWCGKKFKPDRMFQREGWKKTKAFQNSQYFDIDSGIILQPGPASVSEGLEIMHKIFTNWVEKYGK